MSVEPIQLFILTIEDTGEVDAHLIGCWSEFVGWLAPMTAIRAVDPALIPYPHLVCEEVPDKVFLVLRWRIWKPPSRVTGIRWWDGDGEHTDIRDVGAGRQGQRETDQVWSWWTHTRFLQRRGAPRLRTDTLATRHADMRAALQTLRLQGERPTRRALMAIMGYWGDPSRVGDWCRQLGYMSYQDFLDKN
jgi:hypothetical protein